MKQYTAFLFTIFFPTIIFSQNSSPDNSKFNFYLGMQTRVTPIYTKHVADLIIVQDRNIMESPDRHLSGPSLAYKIERQISPSFVVSYSHAIRYDFLYQTFTFNNQPVQGFRQQTRKTIVNDLYLDAGYIIQLSTSEIKVGAGLAVCGIGTGYLLTQRFLDNNNQSFYISSKENFQFPAASFNINWKKGKLHTMLRMGYCWSNPTLFKESFLFPELGVQYQLFSF